MKIYNEELQKTKDGRISIRKSHTDTGFVELNPSRINESRYPSTSDRNTDNAFHVQLRQRVTMTTERDKKKRCNDIVSYEFLWILSTCVYNAYYTACYLVAGLGLGSVADTRGRGKAVSPGSTSGLGQSYIPIRHRPIKYYTTWAAKIARAARTAGPPLVGIM